MRVMSQLVSRTVKLVGLLAVLALAGCGKAAATSPKSRAAGTGGNETVATARGERKDPTLIDVTLQLNWFPEAEHGGFFAALVHGYYQEEGLNVEILPGGPETPVVQQVARRAAPFGVVNADNVLFGRAQQPPVV